MNNYTFTNKEMTVKRITKQAAKKAYDSGKNVLFCPCKLRPLNNYFGLDIWQNKTMSGQYETFEKLYNAYSYYNCNYETGYYIAFYIQEEAC